MEEGPPEIIWQGNEIIVKKNRVKVKKNKKDSDQHIRKEVLLNVLVDVSLFSYRIRCVIFFFLLLTL